ncbi:MAG: helix-turn-helix domain-containing protein [Chromatiales bacterium]
MQVKPEMLPKSVHAWLDAIGLDRVLRIVEKYGGTLLYVPVQIDAGHPLARLIGPVAAKKLSEICRADDMRGDSVLVPKCEAALRSVRDQQILEELEAKLSVSHIAREHGIHLRTVWRIKRRLEEKRRDEFERQQGQLFGGCKADE